MDMEQTGVRSSSKRCSGSAHFVPLRQDLFSLLDIVPPSMDELMRFIARFRAKDGSALISNWQSARRW
jgi:hypothetical protein